MMGLVPSMEEEERPEVFSLCHMRIHLSQEESSQHNLNMLYLDPRL